MDLVAAPVEDAAEGVAVGRPPPAAGVEGAGGVGADELDVHLLAAADVGPGVALDPGLHHLAEDRVQPAVVEAEVHEAGAGHGDLGHVLRRVLGEAGDDGRRQVARPALERRGQGQGDVRRPVAVLGPGRALDGDGGRGLDAVGHQGGADGLGQEVPDHVGGSWGA